MKRLRLGVNIDHVATVRQARYRDAAHAAMVPEPCPVEAALACERAGAHGITAHLREDRRHIQEDDVRRLKEVLRLPLNLEMAVTDPMIAFALDLRPSEICLVPENRAEITTEGGLDVAGQFDRVRAAAMVLRNGGMAVSLFIDADLRQVEAAAETGAGWIELHTGRYANATGEERNQALADLREAADRAHALGLRVNAGHGLNYVNMADFLSTPHVEVLNIGHSIVSRSIFVGMEQAVREMLRVMESAT
ncbi:MAG: pyridoxine 5'-phosphate synthase [Candidatus Methylacidiphilales bacterium]